jgi:hypothetical protein
LLPWATCDTLLRFTGEGDLNLDIDRYLDAVSKFNDLVSELAEKLEQISDARDEALKASADLKRQLETTDQRLLDISSAVRQQITMEFSKKGVVRSEEIPEPAVRRAV